VTEPDFPETAFTSKASKRQLRKDQKDKHRPRVLEPRNEKQASLLKMLKKYPVVFAIGAAGSGKTFIPSAFAAQQLDSGVIDKIVMSRPTAAPSRHKLGFLPGTDDHKTKPWMIPIMDAIGKVLTPQRIEQFKNAKAIETLPFEHMRGRTVSDAFFIVDEAQNCTLEDLELVLTRLGENATLCICGDVDQDRDLGELSGLSTVVRMVEDMGLNAGIVVFDENDVVRSAAAAEWVGAFKRRRRNHGLPVSLI
jgi:phosphate starvation-inducible PhoH-like protein